MTARTILIAPLTAILAFPVPTLRFDKRIARNDEAIHVLNRLTFGPSAEDLDAIRKSGVKKWIGQQLHPEKIAENPELQARLKPLASLTMSRQQIVEAYPPPQLIKAFAEGRLAMPQDPARRAFVQRLVDRYEQRSDGSASDRKPKGPAPQRALARDLLEQKLYRAVYSHRQLEEVLTDFWFNHFNVYLDKGADRYLVTSYERDAIRPHVLGKFKDLLLATAQHPAMLFYLDNWQSASPASPAANRNRRARGLNENYARELLELHTLGVDGGYTQQDVIEVARCFTGWTIAQPYRGAEFTFNPRLHDPRAKTVLGVKIPAGCGEEDGRKVIDILAHHPSTARFLSTKLAQRFVADNPPDSLIETMSAAYRKSGGDLREVMRAMLNSREFWSQAAYRSKVKSPFEMVASALRATGAEITSAIDLANRVGSLGQPLYRKQEPAGYPNRSGEWVNSAALLGRMNFALDLVQNRMPGVKIDPARLNGDPQQVAGELLFSELSAQTRAAIDKGLAENQRPEMIAGLILGSPDFQRR